MAERVVLRGTRSSNVLDVSSELQPYEIYALKGNDRVVGTAFDDLIDGGTGHADLFGGAGHDTFTVSGSTNGDDLVDGGDGHDVVARLSTRMNSRHYCATHMPAPAGNTT